MSLDLDDVTAGWECPPGELRGRIAAGRAGEDVLQLRVDLGVMQMALTGRPDGERCHGLPTARDYVEHELRVRGAALPAETWAELERELQQTNYRRMAYAATAEEALRSGDAPQAQRCLAGALADIETCLADLRILARGGVAQRFVTLAPTLHFDRARLAAQLRITEGRFEEAVEEAEAGAAALDELLRGLGYDAEQRGEDPALVYLHGLGRQLRQEYAIEQTLTEQLAEAVANDDFERAAQLRDQLKQREEAGKRGAC
jgi:hypothetical protein